MEGLKLNSDNVESFIEDVTVPDMREVNGGDGPTLMKVGDASRCDDDADEIDAVAVPSVAAAVESLLKIFEEVEESAQITFCPPIYIQRYCRVVEILKESITIGLNGNDEQLKTVLEVGCAEFSMHVYLSKMKGIGKLIYLDIDALLLEERKAKLRPLPIDYIHKRETPLQVVAYSGCVTKADPIALAPTHAVIAIEIVEHLDPPILEGFVKNIFGVICPSLVIVTTPNSEFNVVFNLPKGKFRHWDHRFEWTRREFEDWCQSVCKSYPSYSYTIEGVGAGPPETTDLGCVSQLAVFRHSLDTPAEPDYTICQGIEPGTFYKLVAEENYPFYFDTTPRPEKILREFKSYIHTYIFTPPRIDNYIGENMANLTLPISHCVGLNGMPDDLTEEELKTVVKAAGYKILEEINDENGQMRNVVVLDVPDPVYSSDSESDDYDGNDGNVVAGHSVLAALTSKDDDDADEEW